MKSHWKRLVPPFPLTGGYNDGFILGLEENNAVLGHPKNEALGKATVDHIKK